VRKHITWVGLGLGALLLLVLPGLLGNYHLDVVTVVLIWAIGAMSLNLVLGYTGLASLGQAAFFGSAAYVVALLSVKAGVTLLWIVLPLSVGVAALLGVVFAVLSLRAQGAYFLLLTMALAQLVWALVWRWRSLTGGDDGLPGIARPSLGINWSLWPADNFYYFTLALFVAASLLMYLIVSSPFGKSLVGIRESETRMSALGYRVWWHKLLAFVLSAAFAGLAGALFAYRNGIAATSYLDVVTSAKLLLMVLVGGSGTFFGPIVGAAFLVLLENFVGAYTQRWLLVMGLAYVGVVLFAPAGLVGLAGKRLRKQR